MRSFLNDTLAFWVIPSPPIRLLSPGPLRPRHPWHSYQSTKWGHTQSALSKGPHSFLLFPDSFFPSTLKSISLPGVFDYTEGHQYTPVEFYSKRTLLNWDKSLMQHGVVRTTTLSTNKNGLGVDKYTPAI